MKIKILLFSLLILTSCKKAETKNIIGTWNLISGEIIEYRNFDHLIFKKDNSFIIDKAIEDNMEINIHGKYQYEQKKIIRMKSPIIDLKFKILKLDEHEMELENESSKKIIRCFRE
ncbi:hypothetical protein [Flavobacterium sp.]|uniref:hypothetical protein n=1 Tax=Flavobacterium sp. TaxID=239 RepID=UPI003919EA51